MKNLFLTICLVTLCISGFAQTDTVTLHPVSLSDSYLLRYSEAGNTLVLNDSVIHSSLPLATDLLNYQTSIYFKENGFGMVSSPSFRGTGASQTAVIWNGININSQLNGQVDFNTLMTDGYSDITVRPGGSGVGYGSSAIGGSIHLNNKLNFNRGFQGQIRLRQGSFNTYGGNLNARYSDEKLSMDVNVSRLGSENNYRIREQSRRNANGEFYHQGISTGVAYKLDSKNTLRILGRVSDSDRHFSLLSPAATPTKYHDFSTRGLAEWIWVSGHFESTLKTAFMTEEFRYYENARSDTYTFGNTQSWISVYDLAYKAGNRIFINGVLQYDHIIGDGSEAGHMKREVVSAALLMKHKISPGFFYEAGIRREFTESYTPPFLFSAAAKWKPVSFYEISIRGSKNFRMPTFNDLFWPGSGNPDLEPEISYQAEINHSLQAGNWTLELTGYADYIKDMINWVPQSGDFWIPQNVDKVHIYGWEAGLHFKKKIGKNHLDFRGTYAYTSSRNQKTKKQLIYVPYEKGTISAAWNRNRLSAWYRQMFVGKVYTDSQNQQKLSSYTTADAGVKYELGKKNAFSLGVSLRNLYDRQYETVVNRPMPGRYYGVDLQFKF